MTDSHIVVARAALVAALVEHQRLDAGSCTCGWGQAAGELGHSFAEHVEEVIEAAGTTTTMDADVVIPPLVNVLAELTHQVSRIAAANDRPLPTITAESAVAAWKSVLSIYEDKAVPFLEALGVPVEQEPTHRLP